MAIQFPIPQGLTEIWEGGRKWLIDALGNVFDPNQNAQPPNFQGMEAGPMPGPPQSLPELMAAGIMPETPKAAYESGIMGMGPMPADIAANYRTPEAIQALRRAMAAENKARGGYNLPEKPNWILEKKDYESARPWVIRRSDESQHVTSFKTKQEAEKAMSLFDIPAPTPDPVDQILRGSWFHGMRPEARDVVRQQANLPSQGVSAENLFPYPNTFTDPGLDLWNKMLRHDRDLTKELPLRQVFDSSLPGSTHATPSYTRFGEPYGISITASPSIAKNFSADEYIHRVQPLYGGLPTERIIPMWRPEGQKVMNEGYNAALNEIINQKNSWGKSKLDVWADNINYLSKSRGKTLFPDDDFMNFSFFKYPNQDEAANFNTLYSKALQDKGYRGILYSPQRYGEYEMLMLDPSFVRPLDYRKVSDYTRTLKRPETLITPVATNPQMTPGAGRGYIGASPEFTTGATRLSDVFSQQSWVDRINEENKRRIAEMIDAQYREQVINQLFGNR